MEVQGRGLGLGSTGGNQGRMREKGDSGKRIPSGPILCYCCCIFLVQYLLHSQRAYRAGCSHADPSGLYQGGEGRVLAPGHPHCCQVAKWFLLPHPVWDQSKMNSYVLSSPLKLSYVTTGSRPKEQQNGKYTKRRSKKGKQWLII